MGVQVHETAVVYPGVELGEGTIVGEYAVLGVPPRGVAAGTLPTVIGPDSVIRSHTVIYAGNRVGAAFHTGHGVLIRELNTIGNEVSIGSHTVVEHHVLVGDGVRVHSNAFIAEYSVLEEGCWVGPCVVFTNTLHPLCPRAKECMRGPRVRRFAKIGAGCVLLPDLEVGEWALVGAGSVVTADVPPRAVVAGNPAVLLKEIAQLSCPYGLMDRPYKEPGG
jgi:acetyltransferase-like isoleucine patch superfamily enzyme